MQDFIPPYVQYMRNVLGMDIKYEKYIDGFVKYYNKMFVETMQSINEKINKKSVLNIIVTNKCYNMLAHITFNMFVSLAKHIANNQVTLIFFGKSTRIQFIQVLQALLDCTPHNMHFSCTQRMMIHYILMSRKALHESAKSFDETAKLVKDDVKGKKSDDKPKRTAGRKKKVSDESDASEEEPEEKPRKRTGRRKVEKDADDGKVKKTVKGARKDVNTIKKDVKVGKTAERAVERKVVNTVPTEVEFNGSDSEDSTDDVLNNIMNGSGVGNNSGDADRMSSKDVISAGSDNGNINSSTSSEQSNEDDLDAFVGDILGSI